MKVSKTIKKDKKPTSGPSGPSGQNIKDLETFIKTNSVSRLRTKKKLNVFELDLQKRIKWWLENIQTNINKSIERLKLNCSQTNRIKEEKYLKDQLKSLKIIEQVKEGKTILQGFNFNK